MKRPVDCIRLHPDEEIFSHDLLRMGGTILGSTTSGNPSAMQMPDGSTQDLSQVFIDGYNQLKLDALISIGGDGSQKIIRDLAQRGNIPVVAIPKTIDNDLVGTENSVGFTTSVSVATEALDRLKPTAASHDRVMILEVMGRDVGHIALSTGIAGGADFILIPEIPYTLDNIAKRIKEIGNTGRHYMLVVVAESVRTEQGTAITKAVSGDEERYSGIGHYLSRKIYDRTGAQTRVTTLGHVQRGGQPVPYDRIMGSAFGVHAVNMIAQGKFDRMVCWRNRQVTDIPLEEVINAVHKVDVNGDLVHTARGLGIHFGDE